MRWSDGLRNVSLSRAQDSRFTVQATNNFFGLEPLRAPDGTLVAAGNCYLVSTGTVRNQYSKDVAVMLSSGTYVMDTLSLEGDSVLTVTSAPVRVYIRESLSLSGGTLVNSTAIPSNVAFFLGSGVRNASVTGGTTAHYVLYAPNTDVKVVGGGDLYGAIVARSLSASGGSRFHYDADLRNGIGGPLQVFSWQRL